MNQVEQLNKEYHELDDKLNKLFVELTKSFEDVEYFNTTLVVDYYCPYLGEMMSANIYRFNRKGLYELKNNEPYRFNELHPLDKLLVLEEINEVLNETNRTNI